MFNHFITLRMFATVFFALFLSGSSETHAQNITCRAQNTTWEGCGTEIISLSPSYADCLQQCVKEGDTKCTHFTFYPGSTARQLKKATCGMYTGCGDPLPDSCPGCVSGQPECADLDCYKDQCCTELSIDQLDHGTVDDCSSFCNNNEKCVWFSYIVELEFCKILSDCTVDGSKPQGTCISGVKGCDPQGDPICNVDSCCRDPVLAHFPASEETCKQSCSEMTKCQWYSYGKLGICYLYEGSCSDKVEENSGLCSSGEKRCYETGGTTTTTTITGGTTSAPGTTTTVSGATTTTTSSTETWAHAKIDGIVYFAKFTDTKEACFDLCVASGNNCVGVSYQIDIKKCQQYQSNDGLISSSIHLSRLI